MGKCCYTAYLYMTIKLEIERIETTVQVKAVIGVKDAFRISVHLLGIHSQISGTTG